MPVGAAIGALGSVAGAGIGYFGAQKAAQTQANALQQTQNQIRADTAPYRDFGQGATYTLANLYGFGNGGKPNWDAFYSSPDYAFAQKEGLRGLESSNAAKRTLGGGNYLRDLTSYSSGLASQNVQNYVKNMLSMATIGSNAATGTASTIGSLGAAGAGAMGAGVAGGTNAILGGINGAGNNLALYNYMNGPGSAYGGGGGYSGPPAPGNWQMTQPWGGANVPIAA